MLVCCLDAYLNISYLMHGIGMLFRCLVGNVLALVQKLHVRIYFRLSSSSISVSMFGFDLNGFVAF